jgi:hypothetical protein
MPEIFDRRPSNSSEPARCRARVVLSLNRSEVNRRTNLRQTLPAQASPTIELLRKAACGDSTATCEFLHTLPPTFDCSSASTRPGSSLVTLPDLVQGFDPTAGPHCSGRIREIPPDMSPEGSLVVAESFAKKLAHEVKFEKPQPRPDSEESESSSIRGNEWVVCIQPQPNRGRGTRCQVTRCQPEPPKRFARNLTMPWSAKLTGSMGRREQCPPGQFSVLLERPCFRAASAQRDSRHDRYQRENRYLEF